MGGVDDQDIAGPLTVRRHPEERIERGRAGDGERMGPLEVDRLLGQDMNGRPPRGGQLVVRQMRMEVERRDAFQQTAQI